VQLLDRLRREPGVSDTGFAQMALLENSEWDSSMTIVNESFVKHYFGDANPIGRHIGFGNDPGTPTPMEIIGVVKDSKYTAVRDEIPRCWDRASCRAWGPPGSQAGWCRVCSTA
jgi:hypothetical protein